MLSTDQIADRAANIVRNSIREHAGDSLRDRFRLEIAVAVRLLEDAAASAAQMSRPEVSGSIIEHGMAVWRVGRGEWTPTARELLVH